MKDITRKKRDEGVKEDCPDIQLIVDETLHLTDNTRMEFLANRQNKNKQAESGPARKERKE